MIFAEELKIRFQNETSMKRLFCCLLIVITSYFAPPVADAQIKFGIKIGTNIASASFSKNIFSSGNRVGFIFGPMIDAKIPFLGLGIDAAIQYQCKYAQLDATSESGQTSGVPSLHTIDIPINAKWTFGSDNVVSAYAATGPQFSWNIGGESLNEIFDISQYQMHGSIFSWNVGAGVNFLKRFRLGYTYNIAIGATADVDLTDAAGDVIHGKLRNNTHQIFFTHYF